MNERLLFGLVTVALGCGFLNSVAIIKHKVKDHNRVPFGDVEEIVIPSKEKTMFEYFKADCKSYHGMENVHRYMTCAERRMDHYLRKKDDASNT